MASELIFKYPLDLSGSSSTNFISIEPHVLLDTEIRLIVPNNGAYYGDSLVITDSANKPLILNLDYVPAQLYQDPTLLSGKEVYTAVAIINSALTGTINLQYQAVGGEFSFSVNALRETLSNIETDSRNIDWKNLIDIPNAFPPSPHLHSAGDVYGFEYIVDALESIRRAVLVGSEVAHAQLTDRVNYLSSLIIPPATLEEAVQGIRDDVVLTPKTAKSAFDYWASLYIGDPIRSEVLQVHQVLENPHNTDKVKLGLGLLENVELITVDTVVNSVASLAD